VPADKHIDQPLLIGGRRFDSSKTSPPISSRTVRRFRHPPPTTS
jgi:hypothetical protein